MSGKLITFEGGEGCGKSTQIKLLEKYLKSQGLRVVLTREPGGSKCGREIRKILLTSPVKLSRIAELLLFIADRTQHVEEVIKPALETGAIVLCDRFIDSTLAYQIGGRELPEDLVRYLNNISSSGLLPDLTFLLDVSASIGLARALGKGSGVDKFESETVVFHEKLRKKYLEIARENPQRIKIINSEKPLEQTQAEIKSITKEFLGV